MLTVYAHSKTNKNWELKKKWRNIDTNYRRQAIKEYWKRKAEDLKHKPKDFYKTFRPFLSDKKQPVKDIHIRNNGIVEKNQEKIANILGDYFSSMASEICGEGVNNRTENDLLHHPSIT